MIVTDHVIVFLSCGFKRCPHTRVDNGVIHILKRRHMFPEKSSNSILCHKQSEKNNQLSVNHDFFSTSFHSLVPAGWNDFQSDENRKLALMGQKRKKRGVFSVLTKVKWKYTGISENPNSFNKHLHKQKCYFQLIP